MSYIVIKVYSFECDSPGCNKFIEVTPLAFPLLRSAERELRRSEKWAVQGAYHWCPEHKTGHE